MRELNSYRHEPEVIKLIENYCLMFSRSVVYEITYTFKRGELSRQKIFVQAGSMSDELRDMLKEYKA